MNEDLCGQNFAQLQSTLALLCEMLDTTTDMATAPPTYGPTHQLKLLVVPHGSAPAAQL